MLRVWVMVGRPGSGPAPMRSVGVNSLAERQATAPPPARGARRLITGRSAPSAAANTAPRQPAPGWLVSGSGCGKCGRSAPNGLNSPKFLLVVPPGGFLANVPLWCRPWVDFFDPEPAGRARVAGAHERWAKSR